LILEDFVMHFPESFVSRGEFGGLGGVFGVWMDFPEGKISEDEHQAIAEMFLHAFDDGVGVSAVRAFVVAVFDEGDGGAFIALDVVV
jgi:hypothetical protein